MTVKDAVAKRFEQLCDQRGIRPNELATRAGVTPSTVYSMLDPSRQRVSIVLHRFLCDGMDGLFCVAQKPKEASALSGVEVE